MFVRMRMRRDSVYGTMAVRVNVNFTFRNMFKPVRPFANPLPGSAGDLKDGRVGIKFPEVAQELVVIKIRVRQEIDLVQHERTDFME